eukprot:CAMPEP_0185736148 /NCGR_PEP_ID=MMETSP1171-20130828/27055_1 /TAXON_ID=374046 /ORGANISM="Helicotheca tamensis, Strain CCMP826" /LENGTH=116 /DNA_ID=CAMNT_0028406673 /DNA_START=638 /DNA_END=984 /DNA_ORIENTATION=-
MNDCPSGVHEMIWEISSLSRTSISCSGNVTTLAAASLKLLDTIGESLETFEVTDASSSIVVEVMNDSSSLSAVVTDISSSLIVAQELDAISCRRLARALAASMRLTCTPTFTKALS